MRFVKIENQISWDKQLYTYAVFENEQGTTISMSPDIVEKELYELEGAGEPNCLSAYLLFLDFLGCWKKDNEVLIPPDD